MRVGRPLVALAVLLVLTCAGACSRAGAGEAPDDVAPAQITLAEDVLAGIVPNADSDRFQLALAADAESRIVSCMRQYRLSYTPKDPRGLVDVTTDTDFASLDYARTYGFGVTAFPTFAATGDPNRAYLASLDPRGRTGYDTRLSACADRAQAAAKHHLGLSQAEPRYARTDRRVHDDSGYRAAETTWARCAASAGHPASGRRALIDSLAARRDEILRRLSSAPSGPDGTDLAARAAADRDFQQLRADEQAAAVATFECSQALDHAYRDRYRQLR